MNDTKEMIASRRFVEYAIGNGKLFIEKPETGILSAKEANMQLVFISSIFGSAYKMIARETSIDPVGELYVGHSPQNCGIHMFEPRKSFIGFMSSLYNFSTANELWERNVRLATTEILHHFHWLAVAERGEYEWIRCKAGLALSELIAGHSLMIEPFRISRIQDDRSLRISLENICAGGYFRYLLSSSFDIERPLGEDEYEIAFLWLISLRDKPWKRKYLFELSIAPSGADNGLELIKEGQQIARLITERNKMLRKHNITIPFETLFRAGLPDCHSERELLSRLRKVYVLEQEAYPEASRTSLISTDIEIEDRLHTLRQEITSRFGVEGHVSRLSYLADTVLR